MHRINLKLQTSNFKETSKPQTSKAHREVLGALKRSFRSLSVDVFLKFEVSKFEFFYPCLSVFIRG
ncbi:MAG: hypothetical protein C5B50_25860 [Verrucomicrobia bacterium]|nr:MAG: hypothetical protein C5B50_25860 [Verrucomicrobiota bacterium]